MQGPEMQLDIAQLEDVIALQTQKLAQIDTAMQAACNTVVTLTLLGWEGQARDNFAQKFDDFAREMRAFYENMAAFTTCLGQIHARGEAVCAQGAQLPLPLE